MSSQRYIPRKTTQFDPAKRRRAEEHLIVHQRLLVPRHSAQRLRLCLIKEILLRQRDGTALLRVRAERLCGFGFRGDVQCLQLDLIGEVEQEGSLLLIPRPASLCGVLGDAEVRAEEGGGRDADGCYGDVVFSAQSVDGCAGEASAGFADAEEAAEGGHEGRGVGVDGEVEEGGVEGDGGAAWGLGGVFEEPGVECGAPFLGMEDDGTGKYLGHEALWG
ncbi:hypothetical protein V495_07975, partial [Pseudogymnoascus sp. VKM F-4514 (FW-929)]